MGNYIDKDKAIALVTMATTKENALTSLKTMAPEDVIPLGVEMWADRFHIKTRIWWSEDKKTESKSFVITRREQKDG